MPLAPLIEEKVLPCSNNNLIKAKVPSSFLTTRCHHFCLVQVKSWWSPCFPTPSDATTSRCWSNKIIPHSAQAPRERESRASTASTLPFYCASYYSNSASPMRPTYWIELNDNLHKSTYRPVGGRCWFRAGKSPADSCRYCPSSSPRESFYDHLGAKSATVRL